MLTILRLWFGRFVSSTEQTDQLTKALSGDIFSLSTICITLGRAGGKFDSAMKDEHIEQAMADARKQVETILCDWHQHCTVACQVLVKAKRHTERVDRMRDLFAG